MPVPQHHQLLCGKGSAGQHAPHAAAGVDGDGVERVVDLGGGGRRWRQGQGTGRREESGFR